MGVAARGVVAARGAGVARVAGVAEGETVVAGKGSGMAGREMAGGGTGAEGALQNRKHEEG